MKFLPKTSPDRMDLLTNVGISFLVGLSYLLLIRPLRQWITSLVEFPVYAPLGMWVIVGIIALLLLGSNQKRSRAIRLLIGLDVLLAAVLTSIQYATNGFLNVEQLAVAHMLMVLGMVFPNLKNQEEIY